MNNRYNELDKASQQAVDALINSVASNLDICVEMLSAATRAAKEVEGEHDVSRYPDGYTIDMFPDEIVYPDEIDA